MAKMTKYISATKLNATTPASDIQVARTVPVWVMNPALGSPFSNEVCFPVTNPVPGITSLSQFG